MRKSYEELETRVIRFTREDVITASGCEKLGDECKKVNICIDLGPIKTLVPRPTAEVCTSLTICMDKINP